MEIKCTLPIRSYLKLFIAKNHKVDPFTLSVSKCCVSAIIFESFKENFKQVTIKDARELDDQLEIRMTASAAKHRRFLIDEETVWQIDGRLNSLFHQSLFDFVQMNYETKGDYFSGILKFMDFYNITDDEVKFETLVKSFYRYRNPSEKPTPPRTKNEYVQGLLFS